jgi:hypothetical protein
MSAEQALLDAYREWHRLAIAAGKAIGKRDWNLLLECQHAARKFQPLVGRLTPEARREWKQSGMDGVAREKHLRGVVSELISRLELNRELLQTARAAALLKRGQLEQAAWNLKRLQCSYARSRENAWTSFS